MARTRLKGLSSLKRSFDRYAEEVRQEVAYEMDAVLRRIKKLARRSAPVETGQLQKSIQVDPNSVDPDELTGSVGTNVEYAAAQEFGFTGTVKVDAHKRTITQAFGEELDSPKTVTVQAHTRRMDIPGNFYLTKAAQAAKQTYKKRISDAIQRAQ
jgi:phage gpG-like protein